MSSAGLLLDPNDPISPWRIDAKSVFWGTGAQILAIPASSEIRVAICTFTGSGFIINTMYIRSADKTQWIPVFDKHLHDADTSAAGGKLAAIYKANQGKVRKFHRHRTADYRGNSKHASSPAPLQTESNSTFYTDISTSTTDESYNNIYDSDGLKADLTKPISMSVKAQFSHAAEIVGRIGTNIEHAQNSVAFDNKIWWEFCDAHGTKVMGGSGNSLGITVQATAADVVPSPNRARGFRYDYTPINQVFFTDSDGGSLTVTGNIPSSGVVPSDNLFKAGVITKNASQVKSMFIWVVEATYETADTWV